MSTEHNAEYESPMAVWSCKIGWAPGASLPHGADAPMREAVARAFKELTGMDAEVIFSGWGDELTEDELIVLGYSPSGIDEFDGTNGANDV